MSRINGSKKPLRNCALVQSLINHIEIVCPGIGSRCCATRPRKNKISIQSDYIEDTQTSI